MKERGGKCVSAHTCRLGECIVRQRKEKNSVTLMEYLYDGSLCS